jgi:hypothetical protein
VSTLDRTVVTEIARLADERPQSAEALRARLYTPLEAQSPTIR